MNTARYDKLYKTMCIINRQLSNNLDSNILNC